MSRSSLYAHPIIRLIIDRNPFFLLSAVAMLVACRLLLSAVALTPGQAGKLLSLVVTLNVYELLLIMLALLLIQRPLCGRDARILLVLEAFFLVDVTFLNSELYSADLGLGVLANIVLLGLGVMKLLAIRSVAKLDGWATMGFIIGTFALLLAIPGMLAFWERQRDGAVTATTLYGFWWLVGLLPIIGTVLLRRQAPRREHGLLAVEPVDGGNIVRGFYVALPSVSIVAHLCGASWVYDTGFYAANVTPLMLGLAIIAPRLVGPRWGEVGRLGLPIVAVLLSLSPYAMNGWVDRSRYAPIRLAMVAAALVYLWHAWEYRRPLLATGVAAVTALWAVSRIPEASWRSMIQTIVAVADWCLSMLPHTILEWGLVTLGSAFGLLGIGLAVSLRRPPTVETVLREE